MAKLDVTPDQKTIIGDALAAYKDEVVKLWKKAEKLGLPEAKSLKQTLLQVEQLRGKITGRTSDDSDE